jgi:hypothetical protein
LPLDGWVLTVIWLCQACTLADLVDLVAARGLKALRCAAPAKLLLRMVAISAGSVARSEIESKDQPYTQVSTQACTFLEAFAALQSRHMQIQLKP